MLGKWTGNYWYEGKVPITLKLRKTNFEIIIESFELGKISGSIFDDIENGGTPGVGTISGKLNGKTLKFVKRMPVSVIHFHDDTIINEQKSHRPIFYSGTLDSETNTFHGTWKFKKGFGRVEGRFVFFIGTKGRWVMKKS